jgi:adenine-specific DNA-methyltransferase
LRSCKYWQEFEQPKIIYPNICKRNEFTFDNSGYYTNQKAFIISCNDLILLAILNSNVLMFLFEKILAKLQGNFYEPSSIFIKDFPIANATETQKQAIESLVKQCLEAKGKEVKELETKINQIVYELYGLSEEEIRIIEGEIK